MKIRDLTDWMIMPQTIEPQGLIHLPGRGPNNRFDFKNKGNNRANEQEDQKINYKPTIDTDEEWKEAGYIDPATKQPRYPQLAKLGPGGFASLVNRGRNEKVTRPQNIKNTTATTVAQARTEFSKLEPDKRQRFKQALQQGEIERPIVVRFGPGDTNDVLIGGNTRFTGLMAMGIQPEVKFIDLSTQQEALEAKLESFMSAPKTKREFTDFERACMEGGHPMPEDAAGVGIITKQNTTADVKQGDEYKNVKKLHLEFNEFKSDIKITDQDLQQLEMYADRLFASLGIDVAFSKHFRDRVNDPRNKKPITMAELTRLFKQIYRQHGRAIAQLGPNAEAVMKDMKTDVNVPFALQWDGKELDLVAKTVIRKHNFATPNQEFNVENFDDGKNPGRKGLSKRVGIPKKATLSQLSKIAKSSTGEKRRMAQWQLNMRRGRKKAK